MQAQAAGWVVNRAIGRSPGAVVSSTWWHWKGKANPMIRAAGARETLDECP